MLAADRQECLASTLRRLDERTVQFARRLRVHQLFGELEGGKINRDDSAVKAEVIVEADASRIIGVLLWAFAWQSASPPT